MQQPLKPLSIGVKVENRGMPKVLVNGGAYINTMPHSLLRNIGKCDTGTKPHNMVMSNYEAKPANHKGQSSRNGRRDNL